MNILIIRLSALGDVVHTLPAVHLLKKHLPGCHITWLVEEAAAELLQGYAGIDRVLVSRRKAWLTALGSGDLAALGEMAGFIQELRSTEYDLVLDFQGLLKSGLLAGLARGKKKTGFARSREVSWLFYSDRAPAPDFNSHAIARHLGLLRHLGISDDAIHFSPLWGKDEETVVAQLLAGHAAAGQGPLVVVHPAAAWPTKYWVVDKMAALCAGLQAQHNAAVVFVGAVSENNYIERIMTGMPRQAANLCGRTNLRELACLLGSAALVVAMDSGPLHLACAAGTPVVALFGPTAPWRTGPFGSTCQVIRKELTCSPCYKRAACPLGHHRCMADISTEEVLAACTQYLQGTVGNSNKA